MGGGLGREVVDRQLHRLARRGGGPQGRERSSRDVGSGVRGRERMGYCIGRCGSGGLVGGRGGSVTVSLR